MIDDSTNISAKTWGRAVESISKVGYMDGAADGQTATFQSSFDMGYSQGFIFGLHLGFNEAVTSDQQQRNQLQDETLLRDARGINCQICLNGVTTQENIVNLYNVQKQKNDEYIQKFAKVNE